MSLFVFNFLFRTGELLTYNVVLVSDVQQSGSVINIHIFILLSDFFPHRVLWSVEQTPLCYSVAPC